MTHLEQITRDAAQAIGRDVSGYIWCNDETGLVITDTSLSKQDRALLAPLGLSHDAIFAPLSRPSDAFILESWLRLNVTYEFNGKHASLVVRCPARYGNMTYMVLVRADADQVEALRERMRAVTQFAALVSIVPRVDHE